MKPAIHRADVVVVFDYRRYEPDALALAQLAAERGGKVVVFTDTWLSPASAHADVVLPSRVSSTSPYDSLVPSLAVIETVVAHVLAALGPSAHDHLRRTEATAGTSAWSDRRTGCSRSRAVVRRPGRRPTPLNVKRHHRSRATTTRRPAALR
ncbi:MurR/RpiR family transcriptional regulator [Streptomyces sp. ICN441]|uniref:MurR/RpiR family transcriptional regulator n=1 Tax=Streptomyces sp. ICN441 TaxID=2558286 RepID=UPI001069B607|nr:SIS domain-containing protein [Streptomyces sp. ICN441]TFE47777.1 MurR/RpiR family transcriptional regulator [Streptomyces sp. ICN441]